MLQKERGCYSPMAKLVLALLRNLAKARFFLPSESDYFFPVTQVFLFYFPHTFIFAAIPSANASSSLTSLKTFFLLPCSHQHDAPVVLFLL
jgi:hypothetical protein